MGLIEHSSNVSKSVEELSVMPVDGPWVQKRNYQGGAIPEYKISEEERGIESAS